MSLNNGLLNSTLNRLLISNFVIVLASKSVVLRWIFNQPESLAQNPISFLILVDEIEKLLGFITLTLYQFMFQNPSVKHLEYPQGHYILCSGKVITMFFVTSLSLGGFGISLMRLLYILGGGVIQFVGEKKVAGCIFGLTQLILFVTTYLFFQNPNSDSVVVCNTSTRIVDFSPYNTIPFYAFGSLLELAIYIYIGLIIYQQNRAMKQFLSVDGFKRRRRENAISITAHFVHFIFELLICVSFPIGVKVYGITPDVNYILGCGPLSVATVVSSQTLRRDVIARVRLIKEWFFDLVDNFLQWMVGELEEPPTIIIHGVSSQSETLDKTSVDALGSNQPPCGEKACKKNLTLGVPQNKQMKHMKIPNMRRSKMPSVEC